MKAAVCEEPRKIIIKEVKLPKTGDDEILIKVKSAAISGSDVRVYQGMHPDVVYPVVMGHEFSGEVAQIGSGVEGFEIGDGVIVEPLFLCGQCPACRAGRYNLCDELMMTGYQIPGAFAEYVIARAAMVYPKSESLPFVEAALVEPLAVAIHAVRRAGIHVGDIVVVLGAGPMGLLTIQMAKKAGARVIATDLDSEKLHLAANLGADYVINAGSSNPRELVMAMTRNTGADIVMECAGTPQTLSQTVDLVRKGGTIAAVGWTGNETDPMPMTRITMNEINLLGSSLYCRDFPTAIELAVSGEINLSDLISHEFDLSELAHAFEELSKDQHDIIKAVVNFPEDEEDEE